MKLREKRTTEALTMIREGQWSIRRAASFAGLRYREMLDKMAEAGIDSGPTLKEFKKSLDKPRPSNQLDEMEEADDRFHYGPVLHCGSHSLHGTLNGSVVVHSLES